MEKCKACLEIKDIEDYIRFQRNLKPCGEIGAEIRLIYHLKNYHCTCNKEIGNEK